jgi:cell division protein FtsB
LVLSALFVDGGVARHERLTEELARLKTLNENLEQDNSRLRKEVDALRHDPRYVQRVAREELGLVGKDEVIFIVPSESSGPNGRD